MKKQVNLEELQLTELYAEREVLCYELVEASKTEAKELLEQLLQLELQIFNKEAKNDT